MRRFGTLILGGAICCFAVGCGEDQPNASTPPEAVNEDFAKKTADMMRAANTGMNKKSSKTKGGAKASAAATPPATTSSE